MRRLIRLTPLTLCALAPSTSFAATVFGDFGVSTTGYISATTFIGNGSQLTNLPSGATDRLTSSTAAIIANQGGTISLTLGGTSQAAYFHPSIGLVAKGISTTGTISATAIATGNLRLTSNPASCTGDTAGTLRYNANSYNVEVCTPNGWLGVNNGSCTEQARVIYPTSRSFTATAMSPDGTKIAATTSSGYIYTSADGGITWTEQTGSGNRAWSAIAISDDGTKLLAATNTYLYLSTNSGVTWTELTTSPGSRVWSSVAISGDGLIMYASSSATTFKSTNTGTTWSSMTGLTNIAQIATNSDGSKLIAASGTFTNAYVYTSNDGGNTKTQLNVAGTSARYTSAGIGDDGTLTVTTSSSSFSYLLISTDNGASWSALTAEGKLSISRDGSTIIASAPANLISTDKGISWKQNNFPYNQGKNISTNANGSKIIGGANYLYALGCN